VKERLLAVVLTCAYSSAIQSQQPASKMSERYPVPYSSMHVVQEEGDFVGWDLRVTKQPDRYDITLFCGEGEIEGPVRASGSLIDGVVVLHPDNAICGKKIELRFEPRGVKIRSGESEFEFVPRHKNFITEERWK
jgi:hypothetical protein